jgi:predicted transposase YbfD/YdcC
MARRGVAAIVTQFEKLSDPRIDRTKRHKLLDMVVIALCATICGADGWVDVQRFGKTKRAWFARFLELPYGIPSHDTFGRVFAALDTGHFLACLHNWLRSLSGSLKEQGIAIDGKTLRGSFDRASGRAALHVVSAWASGLRISLGQVAVDDKSNEITAVPKLLELLELAGAVVTLDAMHCQKETLVAIRARGADYVIPVKANQPKLFECLQNLFESYGNKDYQDPAIRMHRTVERNRGREEERIYYAVAAPAELRDSAEWLDVRSVLMVYRHRTLANGAEQHEVCFYITSLPPKVKRLARLVRGHWGIENSLHWTLDVTFSEDRSRIRKGSGPEIAGIFRRLALTVLEQDTSLKSSIRGKRLQAGWNEAILEGIFTGFNGE